MMDGERNQNRMESGGHDFYDTVEVHCCGVTLIREELLEQIAAGIHSIARQLQNISIHRSSSVVYN